MTAIDQTKNKAFDISWARGDNDPKIFILKNKTGVVIDISGQTFSMAVNTLENPSDVNAEIFKVAGIFVTDGADGQIEFTPPPASLDSVKAPGIAFYDVNRVTPSKKTLAKGRVLFVQDVDKS